MLDLFATYTEGEFFSFDAEFRFKNALADPTAIRLKVNKHPPGDETLTLRYGVDSEITKSAVGKYHADVLLDDPGTWHFRIESDGIVTVKQWRVRVIAADPS
jgi:hypothetical protein